jgi:hypothetical protein
LLAELEDAPPLLVAKGGCDCRRAQCIRRGVPVRAGSCPRPWTA